MDPTERKQQLPEPVGERREASTPLELGYVSAFGILDESGLEPLTSGSGGSKPDNDVSPITLYSIIPPGE